MTKPVSADSDKSLWAVYVWCVSFLKPYLFLLVLLITSAAVVSAAELAIPQFIRTFIDVTLPSRDRSGYYSAMAWLAGIIAIMIAAGMVQNLLRRMLQERAARDLQVAILGHLRRLGFAYFERTPSGQTLSLVHTEVAAVQNLYRQHFPAMIGSFLFSVLSIAIMASTHIGLTLIVIPCFLLYYVFGPMLERKASVSGKEMSQNRIEENQKAYESVSAAMELRAFSAHGWDMNRYNEKVTTHNRSMIRTYWYAYLRGTNRRLTYYAGAIAVFIYGYHLIQNDLLTVGGFVSFLLYYFAAMHRLTAVVTSVTEQKVLMYQAEKLYQFIRRKPLVEPPAEPVSRDSIQGEIRFERVSFSYDYGRPVLKEMDLVVRPGQRVALVGQSGCGKSTALKLIGRFYDPDSGSVRIDGILVRELSPDSLGHALGYVFQDTYLFGSSVKENIRFGQPDATDEEVELAAKAAYAHDFITELPDGYDTLVGERGVRLSGGQKQRISIARMFIKNPAVVLLDEATSALDNTSEREVKSALDRLLAGRTVIAVAHRLTTISDFDAIAMMEDGRVIEFGTYEELIAAGGAFKQLAEGEAPRKEEAGV
ncbi:ABC transporter ATP-binding protein [Paenibacillus sp. GYB004]|uniref:ABC transporter ATP-binding protein n=1 Tax=Paenibacillus sp. GYB004 TaxID=2994393 RepID=UPI002F96E29F